MNSILHVSNFTRIPLTGRLIQSRLNARAIEMAKLTAHLTDPDVSIIVRTRNDGAYIEQLFEDIRAQDFDGKIEIILVDTESTDNTVSYAQAQGANIIHMTQQEFTYPRSLNLGFQAARYPYVLTLVGHSSLASRLTLRSLAYWCQREDFAGMYGLPVAGKNGSIWDRLGCVWLPLALARPHLLRRYSGGMLGANCSIVKRAVWQKLGGYDERYAGGGEDVALARSMRAAGLMVVREPLMTLFHSHGLSAIDSWRQAWHWARVGMKRPQAFKINKIHARRPDLR